MPRPSSTQSPGTPGWRRQPPCWASVKLSGRSTDTVAAAVTKEWLAGWQPTAVVSGVAGVRIREVFVSRASRALEPVDVHRGRRVTSSSMTMSSLQTSVLS